MANSKILTAEQEKNCDQSMNMWEIYRKKSTS